MEPKKQTTYYNTTQSINKKKHQKGFESAITFTEIHSEKKKEKNRNWNDSNRFGSQTKRGRKNYLANEVRLIFSHTVKNDNIHISIRAEKEFLKPHLRITWRAEVRKGKMSWRVIPLQPLQNFLYQLRELHPSYCLPQIRCIPKWLFAANWKTIQVYSLCMLSASLCVTLILCLFSLFFFLSFYLFSASISLSLLISTSLSFSLSLLSVFLFPLISFSNPIRIPDTATYPIDMFSLIQVGCLIYSWYSLRSHCSGSFLWCFSVPMASLINDPLVSFLSLSYTVFLSFSLSFHFFLSFITFASIISFVYSHTAPSFRIPLSVAKLHSS